VALVTTPAERVIPCRIASFVDSPELAASRIWLTASTWVAIDRPGEDHEHEQRDLAAIAPLERRPSRLSAHRCWNTSASTPNAAPAARLRRAHVRPPFLG
jgi:hypothetical protein